MSNENSSSSQRERLLDRLRQGPVTTVEARKQLDIMMPAARVKELRLDGHSIATERIRAETRRGKRHRGVARYVLLPTV
ncbi:MAG: helix-turn-helix domain-containing protein [Methylococcaceae bacterium]|nr:helix-turn-helix domain-containing protein [Methylococcaceae bacterium]